jgi:hypothetical protein
MDHLVSSIAFDFRHVQITIDGSDHMVKDNFHQRQHKLQRLISRRQ